MASKYLKGANSFNSKRRRFKTARFYFPLLSAKMKKKLIASSIISFVYFDGRINW